MKTKTLTAALTLALVAVIGFSLTSRIGSVQKSGVTETPDRSAVQSFAFAAAIEPFAITNGAPLHSASEEGDSPDPVILLAAGTVLILVGSLATFNQQRIKRLREKKAEGERN